MPDRSNVYTDAITNLSSHHVVVVGLARNCEGALPRTLAICEYIADVFGRAYFVFVENGSIDATRHRLNDWTVVRGDCVIIQPEVDVEQLSRTERIAACRNIAIEFSRKNYSHCSLMIAIDMDLDLSDLNRRSFLDAIHYLLSSPNVVGVFPNSFPVYYDLYALRHPVWCPNDVIIELHSEDEEYPASASFSKYIYSRQMYISLETQPIKSTIRVRRNGRLYF